MSLPGPPERFLRALGAASVLPVEIPLEPLVVPRRGAPERAPLGLRGSAPADRHRGFRRHLPARGLRLTRGAALVGFPVELLRDGGGPAVDDKPST